MHAAAAVGAAAHAVCTRPREALRRRCRGSAQTLQRLSSLCFQPQGPARKIFVEFLERSCTAEFSGFLLYKELGRRLKKTNPVVAEVGKRQGLGLC